MPPSASPTLPQKSVDPGHMLRPSVASREGGPPAKSAGIGPIIGTVIILILLGFGALYFWGASMNKTQDQLPFIPPEHSTQKAE